jgi:hypothetical protein
MQNTGKDYKRHTTAGIMHRLQSGTVDRNVSHELLSFMVKKVRCNAYDTILTKRLYAGFFLNCFGIKIDTVIMNKKFNYTYL